MAWAVSALTFFRSVMLSGDPSTQVTFDSSECPSSSERMSSVGGEVARMTV
jgi:hypothetical protein